MLVAIFFTGSSTVLSAMSDAGLAAPSATPAAPLVAVPSTAYLTLEEVAWTVANRSVTSIG
jgi:hypothetical protein